MVNGVAPALHQPFISVLTYSAVTLQCAKNQGREFIGVGPVSNMDHLDEDRY